jgi:hypothetical protein
LGDYNENNVVDAGDYTKWRDNLGGTSLPNDPTPGMIDSTDYDYWKAHFGAVPGAGSGAGAVGVPEPSVIVLLAWALSGALALRRER